MTNPVGRAIASKTVAGRISLIIAVAILGVLFALSKLLTVFQAYDDEGYMLLSLRHYMDGGRLYTDTFTNYGPFYYFVQWILFRSLQFPVTHDGGRLVTLMYWLISAFLAGLFVQRVSKSLLLGGAAALSCVTVGAFLANEPGHPQQLVLLLWMFASYVALSRPSDQTGWRMFLLGAIGAALFFTKINVGVFYLAALATAIICLIRCGWIRLLGVSLSIVYAVTAPYILMHSILPRSRGVVAYCLLVTLCGASTFVLGSLIRSAKPHSARALLYAGTGLLAATSFIVMAGWMQGISLATLVEGVLLYPMKYHQLYYQMLPIRMIVVLFSAIIILGILCTWLWQQRQGNIRVAVGIDAVRCAVGFGTCLTIIVDFYRAHWFIAFLPLSLVPGVRSFSTSELFPRLFLTNLAATEFLVTYPVAGSQLPLATSLQLLWAFLCIADGLGGLNEAWKQSNWMFRRQFRLGLVVPSVLLIITAANAAVGVTLRDLPPRSTLNGSSLLHLRPDQELDYKFLSRNIAANCSILFTVPVMGSFNFWSGIPTPTGSDLSAWTIDVERQQQILDRLQSTRGACVVYNPELMTEWGIRQEEILVHPLGQYIITAMPKATTRGVYEIRNHPNRGSPWRAPESE